MMGSTFADPAFLTKEQRDALRAYVTMEDSGFQNQGDTTVRLHITHSNLKQTRLQEVRLDLHMTIAAVKHKLVSHTGTNASTMRLQLRDASNTPLADLDDARKLGFYSPEDGMVLHVIDLDPTSASANGWLEDVSKVEKYQISEEAYNARENTYRKFKEDKLREDPTWTIEKEMAKRRGVPYVPPAKAEKAGPDYCAEEARGISVGDRCSVEPGDRRGEVCFVGQVEGLPQGWWVGVKYDEPVGKNDGSVKGTKVFECAPGYGGFVRPDKMKVGDYPPLDDLEGSDFDEI
ncbi:unnamed protein product [Pedinophyceae sp. YPF-701]|nr:unnamed protein product [Pedinophyceae sp. YPF-701]